jgi:SagB-type dehydrogenase family enzyme
LPEPKYYFATGRGVVTIAKREQRPGRYRVKRKAALFLLILPIVVAAAGRGEEQTVVRLPKPVWQGGIGVGEALNERRSTRIFTGQGITISDVSLLLWASSGKTEDGATAATRTIPSAGGIYPIRIYLLVKEVESLQQGVYRYDYKDHTVTLVKPGDLSKALSRAAIGQAFVRIAPACIIISARPEWTRRVYGNRGTIRYVHMDAGHAAQNIYLVAASLALGTVEIGAFIDEKVKAVLDLEEDEVPLLILPVGHPARR